MIDLILINRKWRKWRTAVQQCRTLVRISSQTSLVISNIKLKLKMKNNHSRNRDVAKLKENDVVVKYVTELQLITRCDSQQHR